MSSASSSFFSDFTISGLNHVGGWVINDGPPGRSAIVKWNAATKVFAGVKLKRGLLDVRAGSAAVGYLHNLIGLDEVVLYRFLQTETSTFLVLEIAQVEGERARLLLYLREHGTRRFHLELVCNRGLLLVDRRS